MNDITTMYLRLTGYEKGNEAKCWYNEQYEKLNGKFTKSYAGVTVGGFFFQGTKDQLESVIVWVADKGWRYEWSTNHPSNTVASIVDDLKKEGRIK